MARFRIGEPDKAVKELEAIGNLCVANNNLNFAIIAFTNVAVACSRASKHTEAERFSRQAIEYSLKVHHRASFEVSDILFSTLKCYDLGINLE